MSNQTYTPEQKATVIAALLTGQSISQCVEQYDIPCGTVKRWSAGLGRTSNELERTTKKHEIGDLVVAHLGKSLERLTAMLDTMDDSYLRKQSAADFAILYGVLADKCFRILDAIARREATEEVRDNMDE